AEIGRNVPDRNVERQRPQPGPVGFRGYRIVPQIVRQIVDDDADHPIVVPELHSPFDHSFHVARPTARFHDQSVAITFTRVANGGEEEDAERAVARQTDVVKLRGTERDGTRHDVTPE
ncbi:MAG TPA: hypothetical protein DEG44_03940, partial [Candidatus Kerfeldbacteria bacterium]|nr:hypothetical protein [Candidatus Kerfeldbacteria bacterium]